MVYFKNEPASSRKSPPWSLWKNEVDARLSEVEIASDNCVDINAFTGPSGDGNSLPKACAKAEDCPIRPYLVLNLKLSLSTFDLA